MAIILRKATHRALVAHQPSPSTSTRNSSASLSQSVAASITRSRLPLVSPFIHSFCRVRLQNVTNPLSSVFRVARLVQETEHQHLARLRVLHNPRDQAIHLRKINLDCCHHSNLSLDFRPISLPTPLHPHSKKARSRIARQRAFRIL